MNKPCNPQIRHPMACLSSFGSNKLFQRNPWATAWWSAAFPGFGHLMLGKYFTGLMLMGWEFFMNVKTHLNTAIFYSLTGHFDLAKQELDIHWFFLYSTVYLFTIWNSYVLTIDLNKFALLANKEHFSIHPFNISAFEINYLNYRRVEHGIVWSLFTPGLGYLQLNQLPFGFFMLIGYMVVLCESHFFPAVQDTFIGNFQAASLELNPEWYLFLPSLMGFNAYDVYIQGIEQNRLFQLEQSRFLSANYQTPKFRIPFGQKP